MILGDEKAESSNDGTKVRLERSAPPPFTVLIEVLGNNRWGSSLP